MSTTARGTVAENLVRHRFESSGWTLGSRRHIGGPGDWLATKPGYSSLLIEVKTDKAGPWAHFGPAKRAEMAKYCHHNGLNPLMVHIRNGTTRLIYGRYWPK